MFHLIQKIYMTALLVDSQMDQNYLRKVHLTVQGHGHRALTDVVRASQWEM